MENQPKSASNPESGANSSAPGSSTEAGGLDAAGMRACPFCGQRGATSGLPHYRVGCWNAKCVAFVNDSNRYYRTEEEALAAWNGRAAGPQYHGNDLDDLHLDRETIAEIRSIAERYDQHLMRDSERPGSEWALERLEAAEDAFRSLARRLRAQGGDAGGGV